MHTKEGLILFLGTALAGGMMVIAGAVVHKAIDENMKAEPQTAEYAKIAETIDGYGLFKTYDLVENNVCYIYNGGQGRVAMACMVTAESIPKPQ